MTNERHRAVLDTVMNRCAKLIDERTRDRVPCPVGYIIILATKDGQTITVKENMATGNVIQILHAHLKQIQTPKIGERVM
jgi:hypothetical protein